MMNRGTRNASHHTLSLSLLQLMPPVPLLGIGGAGGITVGEMEMLVLELGAMAVVKDNITEVPSLVKLNCSELDEV